MPLIARRLTLQPGKLLLGSRSLLLGLLVSTQLFQNRRFREMHFGLPETHRFFVATDALTRGHCRVNVGERGCPVLQPHLGQGTPLKTVSGPVIFAHLWRKLFAQTQHRPLEISLLQGLECTIGSQLLNVDSYSRGSGPLHRASIYRIAKTRDPPRNGAVAVEQKRVGNPVGRQNTQSPHQRVLQTTRHHGCSKRPATLLDH